MAKMKLNNMVKPKIHKNKFRRKQNQKIKTVGKNKEIKPMIQENQKEEKIEEINKWKENSPN